MKGARGDSESARRASKMVNEFVAKIQSDHKIDPSFWTGKMAHISMPGRVKRFSLLVANQTGKSTPMRQLSAGEAAAAALAAKEKRRKSSGPKSAPSRKKSGPKNASITA